MAESRPTRKASKPKLSNELVHTQNCGNRIRYKGQEETIHHLYKLNVAKMIKDHGWDETDPKLVPFEHTHVYHSVDSRGRPQNTCTPIGGHFHTINLINQGDGLPPRLEVGPPMRKIAKRVGKKIIKSTAPVPNDNHTHTADYIVSEVLVPRKMNAEFAKLQNTVTERHAGNIPLDKKTVAEVHTPPAQ